MWLDLLILLANARALENGDEQMETTIDGQPWVKPPFPYQAKCLQWINEEYQKLESSAQGQVDAVLDGTGCEVMTSAPEPCASSHPQGTWKGFAPSRGSCESSSANLESCTISTG